MKWVKQHLHNDLPAISGKVVAVSSAHGADGVCQRSLTQRGTPQSNLSLTQSKLSDSDYWHSRQDELCGLAIKLNFGTPQIFIKDASFKDDVPLNHRDLILPL